MQGPGMVSGYWSVWHALRLRHGIHVSLHMVARMIKEIDPDGVESRRARQLHNRVYTSKGANASWHVDGKLDPSWYKRILHVGISKLAKKTQKH